MIISLVIIAKQYWIKYYLFVLFFIPNSACVNITMCINCKVFLTRATYVHHFVAKYTIEEQIYHLSTRSRAQHNMSESGEWNMSIDELSSLFTSFDSIPHDEDNFY